MKKSKFIIMTLAVLFAVGAAFTTKPHQPGPLYYISGTQYFPAGIDGENYTCISSSTTCTYYKMNGLYYPYVNDAQYFSFGVKQGKSQPAKKKGN
jgi:hypothetical protein